MQTGPVNHMIWNAECVPGVEHRVDTPHDVAIFPNAEGIFVLWLNKFAVEYKVQAPMLRAAC